MMTILLFFLEFATQIDKELEFEDEAAAEDGLEFGGSSNDEDGEDKGEEADDDNVANWP
jgi:hypothetical protein